MGRHCLEIYATDQTVIRQFLEVLNEHLLTHIGHEPAELTSALGAVGEMIDNERFPLAAKDGHPPAILRNFQATRNTSGRRPGVQRCYSPHCLLTLQ